MKPFRLLDTTTARSLYFDSVGKEYATWLLWPPGRDRVSDELSKNPNPYWETVVRASRIVPTDADTIVVDVGSNLGAYAVPLAKLRPRATVWAFEPAEQSFLHLCTHAFLNGTSNLRPVALALAQAPGLLPLYLPDVHDFGSATLRPSPTAETIGVVRALPLSNHPLAHERVHLMQIHVPDYTAPILRGAAELIRRWQTPLLFELPSPDGDAAAREAHALALTVLRTELEYEVSELGGDHYLAGPAKRFRGLLRRSRE